MEGKYLALIIIVVIAYLCIGAAVFKHIEEPAELDQRTRIRQGLRSFRKNNTCIGKKELEKFLETMAEDTTYALNMLQGHKNIPKKWNFPGSFCFVVTTITTIGYGIVTPITNAGKLVVIIYALIGIPMALLMLGHIGDKLKNVANRISRLNLFSKKPIINRAANMCIIVILGISVLFVAPAIVFHKLEHWSVLEAIYFCFVTLSTIGFGDYTVGVSENRNIDEASNNVYRIGTYIWVVVGLAYISLIINYMICMMEKKGEQVQKQVKKIESGMETLQRDKMGKKDEKRNGHIESKMTAQDKQAMQENGGVALVKFIPTRDCKVEPLDTPKKF